MNIEILEFVDGAKRAQGLTVIIDVFRAFSVACYAFDAGAARIIIAPDPDTAFEMKKKYKRSFLVGERDEQKIPGFDSGNSPTEMIRLNLEGFTVIQTTTAGTRGLINASGSLSVITGSLVNAGAITRYIKSVNPGQVSLVAMGYRATVSADEDLLCARIIADGLNEVPASYDADISALREGAGKRFFNPENMEFSPPTDFFLCTMLNRFDFVLKAEKRLDGYIELVKTEI